MKYTTVLILMLARSAGAARDDAKGPGSGQSERRLKQTAAKNKAGKSKSKANKHKLPEIGGLMDIAFPMWEVDAGGNRMEKKPCTVSSCEWNPYYVTKRYDGAHPDLGGHPTDIDVGYPFYGGSPFGGQPYPGTPHHCKLCDGDDVKAGACPKIETVTDTGPDGPGHVPPHISLAALTWAVQGGPGPKGEGGRRYGPNQMFDYDYYQCRVIPDVLLKMIREYYPRTDGEKVAYPPPITVEGGDFQYEFPAGAAKAGNLEDQEPPYTPGPPHWCTKEMYDSGHWDGVCPYVYLGSNAGGYRHPHIAFAALEVYLAHKAMPDKCHATWLENNPDFLDPTRVASDTPFPVMDADDQPNDTVAHWIGQPVLPWDYTSDPPRTNPVHVSTKVYFSECKADEPE